MLKPIDEVSWFLIIDWFICSFNNLWLIAFSSMVFLSRSIWDATPASSLFFIIFITDCFNRSSTFDSFISSWFSMKSNNLFNKPILSSQLVSWKLIKASWDWFRDNSCRINLLSADSNVKEKPPPKIFFVNSLLVVSRPTFSPIEVGG